MKVFWSWQSDTPAKIGRYLVRDALKEAITHLRTPEDIDEPTTAEAREKIHLDYDRQGVAGSPNLVDIILEKIDKCTVFVADVTLTGEVKPELAKLSENPTAKKLINSNVAIELGYGLKSKTTFNFLMVFNSYYGKYEELPFDLRHKGGGITFHLSPEASADEIKNQKAQLKNRFIEALKPYLSSSADAKKMDFEKIPSTYCDATYFTKEEILVKNGEQGFFTDPTKYSYTNTKDNFYYLRIIPEKPIVDILNTDLISALCVFPLLSDYDRQAPSQNSLNKYGAIKYKFTGYKPDHYALICSTQLFNNGEIWLLSNEFFIFERRGDTEGVFAKYPFIPMGAFEKSFKFGLGRSVSARTQHLKLSLPASIECGVIGLENYYLGVPGQFVGPIFKDKIIHTDQLKNDDEKEFDRILRPFFEKIYDLTANKRSNFVS